MCCDVVDPGQELAGVDVAVEVVGMSKEPVPRSAWQQLHRPRNDSHPGRVDGDSSLGGYCNKCWK